MTRSTGIDIGRLLLDAGRHELANTQSAQLGVFTVGLMAFEVARREGVRPVAFAGHSVGEFAALVAAGVISLDDGARLVAARASAMAAVCDDRAGSMVALRTDVPTAERLLSIAGTEVWIANLNAPRQVVVSGDADAVRRVVEMSRAARIAARPLDVDGAFHTPIMRPARAALEVALQEVTFRMGTLPVVANVDGGLHSSPDGWQTRLLDQLTKPVLWNHCVDALVRGGVEAFVEVGPGKTLTGLIRRCVPGRRTVTVNSPSDLATLRQALDVSRMDAKGS